jgi:GxxExxY protein
MVQRFSPEATPDSYGVIGAALKVHTTFGPGFLEAVYHGALAIELRKRNIAHHRELAIPVLYEGEPVGAPYRADFLVGQDLLLELKAISGLSRVDEAQLIHYLKATGLREGLLLNFGAASLQVRNLANRPRRSDGQIEFQ